MILNLLSIKNLLKINNKFLYKIFYSLNIYSFKKKLSINKQIQNYKFNINLIDLNYLYLSYIKKNLNKFYKLKINNIQLNLKKIILNINKTSLTTKSNRIYTYKLVTGIGNNHNWLGVGEGKQLLFKKAYNKSILSSKKYIYNLKFICNDYKQIKFKSYKFLLLNKITNKKNTKIYNNIIELSGLKQFKLISYGSKTPLNILKAILYTY